MREQGDRDRIPGAGAVTRQRWMVVAIMSLPVIVIALSSLLWWSVQRGYIDLVGMLGTRNNGALLVPVKDIREIQLLDDKGDPVDLTAGDRTWLMLIPGDAQCGEACRQTLWLTRQLHTALGRRALYLRRYYLTSEWPLDSEFAGYLASDQPKLTVLRAPAAALAALRRQAEQNSAGEPVYYLVDKHGYIMMHYNAQHTGHQVIADLKFLMKQSGDD